MKPRKELAIACGIMALCVINYLYLIPSQIAAEGSSTIYPHLLNTMLAIFSVAYAFEALRQMRRQASREKGGEGVKISFLTLYGRTILLISITAVWLFAMEAAGFILSTVVFLFIASYIFGARPLWKPLALSTIMPLVFYGIFRGLNSMLPEGLIESVLGKFLG